MALRPSASASPSPAPIPPAGRAAALAVLPLFALHVALWVAHGAATGGLLVEADTPLARADGAVFSLAYAAVAVALWHAAAAVGRAVRRAGRALVVVAAAGTALGGLGVVATGRPVAFAFAAATVALFTSALAVGAGRWAGGDRATGAALVAFGAATMPLAVVLPAALGGVLPEYAVYEAHFLASGALWAAAARTPSVP